jgi:acyl carrier protein
MFEEVKNILTEQLHLEGMEITMDSRIMEDLGADSLDILQLLMSIEEEQGVTIPDEELATFKVVGDIVRYLESQK